MRNPQYLSKSELADILVNSVRQTGKTTAFWDAVNQADKVGLLKNGIGQVKRWYDDESTYLIGKGLRLAQEDKRGFRQS